MEPEEMMNAGKDMLKTAWDKSVEAGQKLTDVAAKRSEEAQESRQRIEEEKRSTDMHEQEIFSSSPLAKALYQFGKDLRTRGIYLFIFDAVYTIILWLTSNPMRFGGDYPTEAIRLLNDIHIDGLLITCMLVNVTILAYTAGKGIRNIGMAMAVEKSMK